MTRTRSALALLLLACVAGTHVGAQETGRDIETERRDRTGAFLAAGWHPHLAVGPGIPVGRLGDLSSLGVVGMIGAWYIRPDSRWPGFGVDVTYATFAKDTDEPLPGRYQMAGAMLRLTSKGQQRVFFDWLGGYGTAGVGVFRHGATGSAAITSLGASASVGFLVPVYGREGFVESRVQHIFSGATLGRGNGLTFAPLLLGVRF
jgi:hypothetical protein